MPAERSDSLHFDATMRKLDEINERLRQTDTNLSVGDLVPLIILFLFVAPVLGVLLSLYLGAR